MTKHEELFMIDKDIWMDDNNDDDTADGNDDDDNDDYDHRMLAL